MKMKVRVMRFYRSYKFYGIRGMIRNWMISLRQWVLEDKANDGLGGPPNNWHYSREFHTRAHGMSTGHKWYSLHFDNDAFDVWIATRMTDEKRSRWMMSMAAEDFRKLALWYLWRWSWGEWFGLRRWLYYKWLHRHVQDITKRARAARARSQQKDNVS